MRRLLQHSLIAAGVSVLTAGAVVGSLLPGPLHSDSLAVAAPLIASAEPTAAEPSSVPSAIVEALSGREARANRDAQRAALTERQAADARQQALLAQRQATAARAAELERQAEAKQKAAEAKKAAAKKKAAEARKKAVAAKKRAAEAERRAKEAAAKAQGYESGSSPKEIARQMMKSKYGWGAEQFSCYNNIIMRESVWKVHADNPTSSAYGIPQALPGSKMASAGPDWRDNPATQIKWGLGYVKERYGTPCAAWSFKSSHDWY